MSRIVNHDDGRLTWAGAVSVQTTSQWTMPWRLPQEKLRLFGGQDSGLALKASFPSGVRLMFRSDTSLVAGSIVPDDCPEERRFMNTLDLCVDGELVETVVAGADGGFRFEALPKGEKLVELWLPTIRQFKLCHLELSEGASLERAEADGPDWITYGSSITMCATSESPSRTWPAIVARECGLNLRSLGFGSGCFLDITVARVIRDLPADLITFCTGTNALLKKAISERVFRQMLTGFVLTIRDGHPDIPVGVMSPIYCAALDPAEGEHPDYWRACRQAVPEVVEDLKAEGDGNLYFVDGLELLSGNEPDAMLDSKHPNARGYKLMGRNFVDKVIPRVFPRAGG